MLPAMDLSQLRREYQKGGLRRNNLNPDPMEQFATWFAEAGRAELLEPNAMSLCTVSADGAPSIRTVLLKTFDARGFVFFTNFQSRKAREIAGNPRVALHFAWLALERQVAVTGTAQKISTAESLAYFLTRPRGSQMGAWVSEQSSAIPARRILEMKMAEIRAKFENREIPLPSFWGGYRVSPATIEFWQGQPNRLHDRFLYSRDVDTASWNINRLAP